ncbi:MAG TPA: AtpZ/AtpI family protein [Flavobacteriales bacterium]|nr:AtpZ/AtpI family protein [Flavobacteriales bacterium]
MSPAPDPRKARDQYAGYLRYTGLGLTMVGIILAFTYAGWWLDQWLAWRFPLFTILLALLGVTGAMIHLFRETGKR